MMYQLRPYQKKLVNDTREAYKKGFKAPCVVSPCGSGKSIIIADIARMTTANKQHVLFLVHRGELRDQIRQSFIDGGVDMNHAIVGMVQTIVRRLDKITPPRLIITDEGHHGLANSYRKIYNHFPDAWLLGFTATPVRLSGDGLGDVYDQLVLGPTVKELIENKNLAPYKMFAPELIDRKVLKKSRGEYTTKSIAHALGKTIYGDVIKTYLRLAEGKKAICYCASVELSKTTAESFNAAGIPAAHIDGKTARQERDDVIGRFRAGEILILCNVDIVGEGFDVPDCEVSILLRPTKSLSLYIQQSMRCMRYMPGKTATIIDHVGNCLEHGLPDTEREWTLSSSKKANRESSPGDSLRTCETCFAVWFPCSPDDRTCPQCGCENEPAYRELKENENIELAEVTEEIVVDYREPKDCRSMAELYSLAKNRGYKPGWAYYQGKSRGFI